MLDHAPVSLRHPRRAARRCGSRRAAVGRLPVHTGPARLRRDPHPEDRRFGDRVRRERLRPRLLRPAGLPGPVAAVLQADDGRRVRAGLRGRAGVPGRAARHGAAPGPVHLARRRAGLHRRPPGRDGGAARHGGRHAGRGDRPGRSALETLGVRTGRNRSGGRATTAGAAARGPAEIPAVHFTEALAIAGAPADEPDLAPAHERALGEWARREHGSDFLFVTGYPMAKRPFYTHPDPARPAYSQRVRPAVPGDGTGHRRAAAAPVRGLPGRAGGRGASRSSRTRATGRVRARHATARRLRHRAGALRVPAAGAGNVREVTRSRATCTGSPPEPRGRAPTIAFCIGGGPS